MSRRVAAALLAVTAVLATPAAASAVVAREVKVLGGTNVAPGQFPWMAALVDAGAKRAIDGMYCGGSVLAPRVVLTAAHCLPGVREPELDVVVGRTRMSRESDGERVDVSKILRHPGYDATEQRNDLALLQLARPVAATPLALPGATEPQLAAPGTRVVTAGWGTTSEGGDASDDLQFVRLTVRSDARCDKQYGDVDAGTQVCASSSRAGEDSCQGDSGGPLFAGEGPDARILGIVSYGFGCGRAGVPGVYTRVGGFAQWIADNTTALNEGTPLPPTPVVPPPVVRIGDITCGVVICKVALKVTGRKPAGGIVLNVVRKKTRKRKGVDRFVFARQDAKGNWYVKADLPYGNLTLYAIPLTKGQDDLDGDGDVQEVAITRG